MADAIVQTIKVEVEGGDEAAAALKEVGESASTSFEETEKAAQTAGVSIEEFGRLSEKTQKSYIELSQRVEEGSQAIVGSTEKLGGGLDEVSGKSGLSNKEMRALGKVMSQLGAGEVAGLAISMNKMASAFGPVGVAILGAAMAVGHLVTAFKDMREASESVTRLSEVLSDPPERIRALQSAFKSAGVGTKDFEKALDSMALKLSETFAKMGETLAASEKSIADAELAAAKAEQAASSHPETLERGVKAIEQAQKAAAAWQAGEKLAIAYANSISEVVKQLKRVDQGQQLVINSMTSTETVAKSLAIVLAENAVTAKDFGNGLSGLSADAETALDQINRLFNAADAASKLKIKDALKMDGIPESIITSITKTTEKYEKLKLEAGKLKLPPELQARMDDLGPAADRLVDRLSRIGKEFLILAGLKLENLANLPSAIGQAFDQSGITEWFNRLPGAVNASIALVKDIIVNFVTTPVANAWQWIVDTFKSGIGWIGSAASQAWASIVAFVTTPAANAWQWIVDKWNAMLEKLGFGGGTPAPAPAAGGGAFAGGGLLGGRGTGTSDSNLAWVSRGEHIMPARAVSQPGVLAFLEALRRSGGNLRDVLDGMGRFALGGMVRAPIAIPAFAGGGGVNNVTIQFPGLPEITGLRASSAVVDELRKAAAMAQVRSGGRKPSRYS